MGLQAMENSLAKDYVSEKLWHAFRAGCVPIYYGAPNIIDFLPDPSEWEMRWVDYWGLCTRHLHEAFAHGCWCGLLLAPVSYLWPPLQPSLLVLTTRAPMTLT